MKKVTKVLYVASEVNPFIRSGGLGYVAQSLTQSLCRKGIDCRVVMPLYSAIPDELRKDRKFVADVNVNLGLRDHRWQVFQTKHNGVKHYLLDNTRYFDRNTNPRLIYDEFDKAEQFAFFSKAVLEMLPRIGFTPDIIVANDWHTAMIPVYYQYYYAQALPDTKTAITIHNIAFQGEFSFDVFEKVLGLPPEARGMMEYKNKINFLKAGIQAAHAIITVSPNYAQEIIGKQSNTVFYDFGHGLSPLINSEADKLIGILNGDESSPVTDVNLSVKYDIANFRDGKDKNKKALQIKLNLEQRADVPLIAIVTRIDSKQKGCELILKVLNNGLLDRYDAQFVILGTAAPTDSEGIMNGKELEWLFKEFAKKNIGRVSAYIDFDQALASMIYAAADIYLMPSLYEPCGTSQMIAMKYGAIPVVRETGGLADTVIDNKDGKGTGYTFIEYNSGDFSAAIERALEDYKDKNLWNALIKNAMSRDYSWDAHSVKKYIELFNDMIK